jgi:hypothetical protein
MQITTESANHKYKPVSITITLETEKEFNDFTEMCRFTDSIPEMLDREESKCDSNACGNMLSRIYHSLKS